MQGFAQTAGSASPSLDPPTSITNPAPSSPNTDPPVVQIPHGGSYHGEWALLIAQQTVIANETAVAWKNWRCEIGTTFRKFLSFALLLLGLCAMYLPA